MKPRSLGGLCKACLCVRLVNLEARGVESVRDAESRAAAEVALVNKRVQELEGEVQQLRASSGVMSMWVGVLSAIGCALRLVRPATQEKKKKERMSCNACPATKEKKKKERMSCNAQQTTEKKRMCSASSVHSNAGEEEGEDVMQCAQQTKEKKRSVQCNVHQQNMQWKKKHKAVKERIMSCNAQQQNMQWKKKHKAVKERMMSCNAQHQSMPRIKRRRRG
eukprot:1147121-Pelagomonas_calceolata.AAC.9